MSPARTSNGLPVTAYLVLGVLAPDDLAIGMRVQVQFHAVGPDVTLPYFTGRG